VEGWISLHRKLLDNPIFCNPDLLRLWIWCLLKATHKKHQQMVGLRVVELDPGQFIFGRKSASKELGYSENKTYRLLKTLEELKNISVNSNNKFSVVTIVNWQFYQSENTDNRQQIDNKQTTNRQQIDTNNNVNNVNKYIYSDFVKKMLPIYPGKKVKAVRDKKLPKILDKYSEDEILRVVNRYASEVAGKEQQYILNESTFWTSRYIDYLDENYQEAPRYNLGSEKYL